MLTGYWATEFGKMFESVALFSLIWREVQRNQANALFPLHLSSNSGKKCNGKERKQDSRCTKLKIRTKSATEKKINKIPVAHSQNRK
jgi:hypothetical protein